MSEPKLISPMLDNFRMGDPISEHNGICCCPAMERETDNKYIVKIISIPASQTQLDALLLSGAYKDSEAALTYFKQLTDEISNEVTVLNQLAEQEGYLPVEACQIVPMDDGVGYDLYLLSAYRGTLERKLRRGCLTHLEALNLGLDLCGALAVARKSGYIYVDLKPGNVYLNNENGYRIGDIGFLKLNSLKYASLPDRYRSEYTAPEITDAYSSLNTSIDVYALGLILYQVFNDGKLPAKNEEDSADAFPAPDYADYEMSEIILKACAVDPAERWQNPMELGQALVSYIQRNGAHDTPIVPMATPEDIPDEELADEPESTETDTSAPEENTEEKTDEIELEEISDEDPLDIDEDAIYTEDDEGNLTFLEGDTDETMEAQDPEEINYEEVTSEVSEILEQADELIAHDTPDPVIPPEPIDVPVPPLEVPCEEADNADLADDASEATSDLETDSDTTPEETDDEEEIAENEDAEPGEEVTEAVEELVEPDSTDTEDETDDIPTANKKPKRRGWILATILGILAAALLIGGVFFYRMFYLQTIDELVLEAGGPGELTVRVLTEADEAELTVVCTDTYGNPHTSPVVNNEAVFTQLTPNSAYAIKVITTGFHQLTGKTTTAYTTPSLTEIVQFTAVTGAEDGSVILSFSINGPDADRWIISYTNDVGSEEQISFAGHMVTFNGLTIGREYLFSLTPEKELLMTGVDKLSYTAQTVVKPEKLHITSFVDNTLTAKWSVRPNADVSGWTVRCYNDQFDETIVVTETVAEFKIPDTTASYTVEVTASGMSVSERIFVPENATNVKDFTVAESSGKLTLSWNPVSNIPADGYVLSYTVGGSAPMQVAIGQNNHAEIDYVVPGCEYRFTLQTNDGTSIVGGTQYFISAAANSFSGYSVDASNMEFMMCRTPAYSNWDRYDLSDSDYTTSFTTEEKASFLIRLTKAYDTSGDMINTLFVIKDELGTVVSTEVSSRTWSQMWWRNYCELDIPSIPQVPGNYTIFVYFNGAFASQTDFTVTE